MENLVNEFTERERKKSCKGCQCLRCINTDCPVFCKAHIACDFKVARCEDYREIGK